MNALSRVIRASAGTGKTYRLTSLFLRLLLSGTPPTKILATTFTRKAAAEIRDRILARLVDACDRPHSLEALSDAVDMPLSRDRCMTALRRMLEDLDRVSICTIDSLLVRLSRACAPDIGLQLDSRIAEDSEDAEIRLEALDSLLDAASFEARVQTVSHLHKGLYRSNVTDLLLDVATLLDTYRESADSAWIRDLPPDIPSPEVFDSLVAALAAAPAHPKKDGTPSARWVNMINDLVEHLRNRRWRTFINCVLVTTTLEGDGEYHREKPQPELARALAPLVEIARNSILRRLALCNHAAHHFLDVFNSHYLTAQDQRSVRRLADITQSLRTGLAATGLESLYYRLDAEFDHLMLDEFQDTSIAQYEVLKPLIHELLSYVAPGGIGERSVVCVGDTKQTLYRWRSAEPEVLEHLATSYEQMPSERLDTSYRSSAEIVRTVNTVFGSLSTNAAIEGHEHAGPAAASWSKLFTTHTTVRTEPGYVRLSVAPDPREGQSAAESVAVATAERVAAVARRVPHASIGVLVRSRAPLPRLVTLLRGSGVMASEDSTSPLVERPIVAAALSALRFVDHPADTLAHFHAVTSPLNIALRWSTTPGGALGLSLDTLRASIAQHGIGKTVASWALGIRNHLADEEQLHLADLAHAAHRFDQGSNGTIGGFLSQITTARTRSGIAAQVRVMTVHAAKGLEFDAVFLPELDGRLVSSTRTFAFIGRSGRIGPVDSVVCLPRKDEAICDPSVSRLRNETLTRGAEEELSILYVAMTRARRHLEMVIAPQKVGANTANTKYTPTLAGVLHAALAPTLQRSPGSTLVEYGDPQWHKEPEKPSLPAASRRPSVPAIRIDRKPESTASSGKSLVGSFVLLDDDAILRGRLFHVWFELVEWADGGTPKLQTLIDASARLGRFDRTQVRRDAEAFRQSLTSGEIGRLLRRDRYAAYSAAERSLHVLRERRFTVRDLTSAAPSYLTGQFDRCVIISRGGLPAFAEVLDFKSDTIPSEDAGLLRLLNRYRDQLVSYRSAASKLFRITPENVRCTLCSITTDRSISLDDPT